MQRDTVFTGNICNEKGKFRSQFATVMKVTIVSTEMFYSERRAVKKGMKVESWSYARAVVLPPMNQCIISVDQ
jgi:hypothetical protein